MSIQVQFDAVGPGTCGWCKKERDAIYHVAFSDKSFVGPMCKNDLLRAVEMKCPVKPAPAPLPVGNGVSALK